MSHETADGAPTSPSPAHVPSVGHPDAAASAAVTGPKTPACGACGHQKIGTHGKGHYFGQCALVVGNLQCVSTLIAGHFFYTGAQCQNQHCVCRMMCPKCRRPGHTQKTIALDPRLFKRVISEKGVSFNKKGHKRLEYSNYVCQGSTPAFFPAEVQRVRAMYAEKDAALNQTASERAGLVSNIVGAVAPVTTTVATLRSLGSSASGLAMPNLVAIGEQARLADTGLSACASALGGAISAATGRSSGITDDLAALAKLRGAEAAARRVGAKRLSQSALSLSSPSGSHRIAERRAQYNAEISTTAVGVEVPPVAPPPARLRRSPAEAAMDLTELIFGDEQSVERVSFLAVVTTAAAKFGIRGSTLSRSGDVARLTSQLLDGVDETADARSSYEASCNDWIRALREKST
ncbi:hypothetical protein I4F81_006198 [Pyropia yezoensis]|uniref:Uncharacterized protein n=1 Tax=Pyropia yezoensis TaxID=2788 RepID=A0ACC3BZY8_PYRYE|nr:hypothetical protein I4F81_006198 [Neopyropia yezoensis]